MRDKNQKQKSSKKPNSKPSAKQHLLARTVTLFLLLCAIMLFETLALDVNHTAKAASAQVKASLSDTEVKVGNTVKVKSKQKELTYQSSDTAIAYVNDKGVITGKKAGTVTITVKKSGYKAAKLTLKVVKKKYKPNIKVVYDEIEVVNASVADGQYQMQVKNNSVSSIKKIVFTYQAKVVSGYEKATDPNTGEQIELPVEKTKTLKITTGKIGAGKTSKVYRCQAPASGEPADMMLVKVQIFAGDSKVTYNAEDKESSYGWGTEDRKAPVISGLVGRDSYNDTCEYITLYKDLDFDFSKYIKAEDDRDGKVEIFVDTDDINYNKPGVYTLTVTACDGAGNEAEETLKVRVRKKATVDEMADAVLKKITKPSASDTEKVRAIYRYVYGHVSYTSHSKYHDWENAAIYGFRYGYGDCVTYYACCRALLTRAGIPNLKIQRNTTNPTHYWNMAYVQDGWYHVDCCWRQGRYYLCLLTDEQLTSFSNYYKKVAGFYPNTWSKSKYPASATKKITKSYR